MRFHFSVSGMEDLSRRDRATIERARRLLAARLETAGVDLAHPKDVETFVLTHLADLPSEHELVIALDDNRRMIGWWLWPGSLKNVALPTRQLVAWCLGANATHVLLAHNHPDVLCSPDPSDQDVICYRLTRDILRPLNLHLLDAFLVSGGVVSSVFDSQLASDMMLADLHQDKLHARLRDVAGCLDAAIPLLRTAGCPTPARVLIEHAAKVAGGT
jgi:DNA repair protein RadC